MTSPRHSFTSRFFSCAQVQRNGTCQSSSHKVSVAFKSLDGTPRYFSREHKYNLAIMEANRKRGDSSEPVLHATLPEDDQEGPELVDPDTSTQIPSSDNDAAHPGAIDSNLESRLPSTAENTEGRLTTYLGDMREQLKASGTLSEPQIRKFLKSLGKTTPFTGHSALRHPVVALTDQKSDARHSLQHAPEKAIKKLSSYSQRTSQHSHFTPPVRSSNPLLGLPAELRNRIYRFALVQPKTIDLDETKWHTHQPAVLKTCKQIRREALGLFYFENKFCATIHDWDPSVKDKFSRLMTKYNTKSPQLCHWFSGDPNWSNLLEWLRAVHEARIGGIGDCVGKERSQARKIVGILFMIARRTRAKLSWPEVVRLLEAHREVLGQIDVKWLL